MSYRPLDCDASVGQYKIDGYASLYAPPPKSGSFDDLSTADKEPYVKLLRSGITRAAAIASTRVRIELKDNSATREFAQRLLKTLSEIGKLTAWLQNDESSLIAAELSRVFKAKPPEMSVIPSVVSIIDDIGSVRAWHARLQESFVLVPPLPNNVDLLGQYFVEEVAKFHKHYTCKNAPKSRTSNFAHLLAAAWEDLKFPVPFRKDGRPKELEDLAALLGSKIERPFTRSRQK